MGYREHINMTLDYVYDGLGADRNTKSPIEIMRTRYGAFPKIIRNMGFTVGAEIGVASGYFSKHLDHYCSNFKLYSIDAWAIFGGCMQGETQEDMENLYRSARLNLTGTRCKIVRGWSMDVVKRFSDKSLDFVYIDAAHDYKNVYQDIQEWSKKVKKDGIVAGHDYQIPNFKSGKGYEKEIYDVKTAVNDWVKNNKIDKLFILNKLERDMSCPSWFYVKK